MEFGKLLKDRRKELNVSQRQLAEWVGVDFTYISKIENEILAPPSEETIQKMAHVLQTDAIQWILSAGKIPAEFQKVIIEEPHVVSFIRKAPELTESDWKEIYEIINH